MTRKPLKFVQLVSSSYSNADRRLNSNIWGLTADGAVYQLTGRGWKAIDMTILADAQVGPVLGPPSDEVPQ